MGPIEKSFAEVLQGRKRAKKRRKEGGKGSRSGSKPTQRAELGRIGTSCSLRKTIIAVTSQ
jgi:hypothetical protein